MRIVLLIIFFVSSVHTYATLSDTTSLLKKIDTQMPAFDQKIIGKLDCQYKNTEKRLVKQTTKWLKSIQKEEEKLKKKLAKTDSLKAEQVFGNVKERYGKLAGELSKKDVKLRNYIPSLDSLSTVSKFLQQNKMAATKEITGLTETVGSVQQKMQNLSAIKKQLQQRKEELKQQLNLTTLKGQLQGVNKQFYYYNQQLQEYKDLFESTDKLTDKAISMVRELPAFKSFFNTNSQLSSLFGVPENGTNVASAIGGLQTRASVMQGLQQRMGIDVKLPSAANTTDVQSLLKDKFKDAKDQINSLKNKLDNVGDKVSDSDMPNFKPNSQKTKSFAKRLEFGFNIQSQKNTKLLPTTSDLALTVGYKLNDKATTGLGIAYKLGWGNGWENISLTNQGFGIRSFLDIKLFPEKKGALGFFTKNLWLTGGYELNYLPELKEKQTGAIGSNSAVSKYGLGWQEAMLFGVSRKQKIGKKTASFQLLYNMFYKTNTQQTQPIVFRVGYSLK